MTPRTLWENRRWLGPLLANSLGTGRPSVPGVVHLILAIADHFEPDAGGVSPARAMGRVTEWVRDYPAALGAFRDADGRPPRHTFFYPVESYDPAQIEALARLCGQGFGEVEVHLHHHDDDAENLRRTLSDAAFVLSERHGLLARRKDGGGVAYGFVHGNWALNNARPDGRWCGVNDEIRVLRETGCYADFTYPSAPGPTQPPTLNRAYYATSNPSRPRGHDRGIRVGDARQPAGSLMLIEGPLAFNGRDRKWGLVPRLENGCVQSSQPATVDRLRLWLRAGVRVATRPDWFFVKLHAHGAPEQDRASLLGPPMVEFHRGLARKAADDPNFRYHYVTAREMYNLVRAAEAGWQGEVDDARDFELVANGRHAGQGERVHANARS